MDKICLIINPGSASKKYALYQGTKEIAAAHFEYENGSYVVTMTMRDLGEKSDVSADDFLNATRYFIDLLVSKKVIGSSQDIAAIGLRAVAPGEHFLQHRIIDDEYIKLLRDAADSAPLHIGLLLSEIEFLQKNFSGTTLAGISDSAFHATMASEARHYALPQKVATDFGIYRYGYHGISAQSVIRSLFLMSGKIPSRIVICHLGSGSSVTALQDGASADTSMGFTPLEGMIMATRVGDIDPGATMYLSQKLSKDCKQLNEFFNEQCGLLGVSGESADVRELLKLESEHNKSAALALSMLVYRAKKYIGAYAAALNGIDTLIFTGTIGERSHIVRSRICTNMSALGIHINETKNSDTIGGNYFVHRENSPVNIAVISANEMSEMAHETIALVS